MGVIIGMTETMSKSKVQSSNQRIKLKGQRRLAGLLSRRVKYWSGFRTLSFVIGSLFWTLAFVLYDYWVYSSREM